MKRTIVGLFLIVSIVVFAQHASSEVPLIPRKELFGNPEKASPSISPDGKKLAYLAPDENDVLNVYVRDLVHGGPDVKITQDKKRGVRSYAWHYDNEQILYSQDKDGDENTHLYLTNLQTHTTTDLTPFDGAKALSLAYNYKTPNDMLVLLNDRDKALFDVYRLDLATGKLTLELQNNDNTGDYYADHRLNVRASFRDLANGERVLKVRQEGVSEWKELLRYDPSEDNVAVVGFPHDGLSIDLLSSLGSNTLQFVRVNLLTGAQEVLFHDPKFDISGLVKEPKTAEYLAIFIDREEPVSIPFRSDVEADFAILKDRLKEPFFLVNEDVDNDKWVLDVSPSDKPDRYYLYDRKSKEVTFLFSSRPVLEKYTMSVTKPVTIVARDGLQMLSYLTLPVGKDPHNLPTVLFVHGGPWARDSLEFASQVQWLANRGYAVLQVNFRGSTGFGKAFTNAGNREWGGKMHDDLLDAKEWLVAQGIADPEKVAIFGGSYGGYAALAGLTFTPEAFAAGVDIVGPSNLVTLLETFPPYWMTQKEEYYRRIGNLDTEKEFLEARSPLFKAGNIVKPLLIAQGANDPRVKKAESDQIVAAMRSHGKPVMYLLFADEGHGFARPENRLKFFAAAEQFLAEYLGGRAEAPDASENWDAMLQ